MYGDPTSIVAGFSSANPLTCNPAGAAHWSLYAVLTVKRPVGVRRLIVALPGVEGDSQDLAIRQARRIPLERLVDADAIPGWVGVGHES